MTVIIPSRNDNNALCCVAALRKAGEECNVILVNDGLTGQIDGCTYVDGVKPFVYARNINIGIAAAGDDDVLLLNDDALLSTPMGFSKMVEAARLHPELGVVGATCNNVGNENQHPKGIGMRVEERMVCFVAVYIPRSTLVAVGPLDERFVGYGLDDDDYCLRVRLAGLRIGIYDGCFVDHSTLHSAYRGDSASGGDFRGNLRLFIEKYGHDNRGLSKDCSPWKELWQ